MKSLENNKKVFYVLILIILISIGFTIFWKPLFVFVLFLIGLLFFIFPTNKSVVKTKQLYNFFHSYSKAIFYTVISLIIVILFSLFIPSITSDNYYLEISDLPKEYIDNGYTKEVLKNYLLEHTEIINKSDNTKSLQEVENENNLIKLEVLGNSVYLNDALLFFRKIIGNNKIIHFQFGKENDSLFYKGYVFNKKKHFLNKVKFGKGAKFSENNVKSMTKIAIQESFKYTHFRKLVSFLKFSKLGMKYLAEIKNSDRDLFYNDLDELYFYRVLGNIYFNNRSYYKAEIEYLHALSLYEKKELDREGIEYEKLIESYILNLFTTGRSKMGLQFIEDLKINQNYNIGSKLFKTLRASLHYSLGDSELAKKLYEDLLLHTKYYGNTELNNEYKIFNRYNSVYRLIDLYQKDGEFEKVIEIGLSEYKNNTHNNLLSEVYDAYCYLGENEKAYELYKTLYKKDAEAFLNVVDKNRTSLFSSDFDYIEILSNKLKTFNNKFELLNLNIYPNNRHFIKELLRKRPVSDTLLVKKSYDRYIRLNGDDIQIKGEYIRYLYVQNKNITSLVDELIEEQYQKNGTINQYFYCKKIDNKHAEMLIKNIDTISIDFLKSIKNDTIISKLYNPVKYAKFNSFKYISYDFKADNYFDFHFDLKGVSFLDSIKNKNIEFGRIFDNYNFDFFYGKIYNQIGTSSIDSLVTESLAREYHHNGTLLALGIEQDILGNIDHSNAIFDELMYKDYNSYFEVADFYSKKRNYIKSIEFYEKGFNKVDEYYIYILSKYYRSLILGYTYSEISKKEYDRHLTFLEELKNNEEDLTFNKIKILVDDSKLHFYEYLKYKGANSKNKLNQLLNSLAKNKYNIYHLVNEFKGYKNYNEVLKVLKKDTEFNLLLKKYNFIELE